MSYTVQAATGVADVVAGTTHTIAHALTNGTSGTNRIVKLVVIGGNRNTPTCTYNSGAGTRKDNDTAGNAGYKSCSTFVWNDSELPSDTSSHNFVITWEASCDVAVCLVIETSDETQSVATYNLVSTVDTTDPHELTTTPANDGAPVQLFYFMVENRAVNSQPGDVVYTTDVAVGGFNKRRIHTPTGPTPAAATTYTWDLAANAGGWMVAIEVVEDVAGGGGGTVAGFGRLLGGERNRMVRAA